MPREIDLPPDWEKVDPSRLSGILMIIGGPDAGKTTFARYLYQHLCSKNSCVAYLDGDPGQIELGPPGTMALGLNRKGEEIFPPGGKFWMSFTGSTSPRGHMIPFLISAARLVRAAFRAGASCIVYDTSGFVSPPAGGPGLKWAKINLLRPDFVFALQREKEIEPILSPLRRTRRVKLVELSSSPAAVRRNANTRRLHRAERYAAYFRDAKTLSVDWSRLALFPGPYFDPGRIIALEDLNGYALGLGVVESADPEAQRVLLRTPLRSIHQVDALRVGDLSLDLQTFFDRLLFR